MSEERNALTSS